MLTATLDRSTGSQTPSQAEPGSRQAVYSAGRSPERLLLNIGQAAAALGVSERKFHALRHAGVVPAPLALGPRALRWDRDELLAHIRQHAKRGSGGEPTQLAAARMVARPGTGA